MYSAENKLVIFFAFATDILRNKPYYLLNQVLVIVLIQAKKKLIKDWSSIGYMGFGFV